MPSASPGLHASSYMQRPFDQIFPGAPNASLQSLDTFTYRQKRYVAYISGSQLYLLTQPNVLLQALTFPNDLVAFVADDQTGDLLVADKRDIWVLRPYTEGWTKIWWEKALELQREDAGDETQWLCWGNDGEALVGGSRVLSLFSTRPASSTSPSTRSTVDDSSVEKRKALWSKGTSSPILFAEFSPSATLIASCSRYDRLLKIWRRLSFEEGLFDYTYLRHPGAITHVQWRLPSQSVEDRRNSGLSGRSDEDAEVLFTVADDAILRIWRTAGMHDADIMIQYATIDLVSSVPQSPTLFVKGQPTTSKPVRFFFILSSQQFCTAIRAAIGFSQDDTVNHSTEYLTELLSKEPDVVVSFDGHGRMSAWGLQTVCHKRRPDTPSTPQAFHITHAEAISFKPSTKSPAVFKPWTQDGKLNFLVHVLDHQGQIMWWEGNAKSIFSLTAPGPQRFSRKCTWRGHHSSILSLHSSEKSVTSRSCQDAQIWKNGHSGLTTIQSRFTIDAKVNDVIGFQQGNCVVVTNSSISLWDRYGDELKTAAYDANRKVTAHILTSNQASASGFLMEGNTDSLTQWTVNFAKTTRDAVTADLEVVRRSITQHASSFKACVPVSSPDGTASFLIICTKEGRIHRYPLSTSDGSKNEQQTVYETGVHEPSTFAASYEFAAIVSTDSRELIIINLMNGVLEHRQIFDHQIRQIKSITCQPQTNLLAVAFPASVQILTQGRYTSHRSSESTWIPVKSASIEGIGLDLHTLAWLSDCTLVATAGNGLLLSDRNIKVGDLDSETQGVINVDAAVDPKLDLRQLAELLQSPLPAWHPDFLSSLVEYGQLGRASSLLRKLARKLKFWSPGDHLDPFLDDAAIGTSTVQESSFELSDDTISDIKEQMEEKALPQHRSSDHQRLKHVLDALAFLRDHVNGLDQHALRYLYAWKLQQLEAEDRTNDGTNDKDDTTTSRAKQPLVPTMNWKDIAFARQSTTQQPLLDFLVLHYDNKMTWQIARSLGVVAWLSDREALEQVFEQLAQTAYRSQQPADPVDASLYFLALHKKPTLLALWRIATWHKEQRSTTSFLKRDFSQPEAKTAAKKNAYALMGKRRFEYCAAFFLLADDPGSATSVLAGQCDDLPLAIAVARLYSGDGSPVLRKLLEDRVMPQAAQDGDRWLLSWCHTVLHEPHDAAESLVMPLPGVRTWWQEHPSTLLLYRHLRRTASEHEYGAVLRSARMLRRMGLGFLALELVSRWEFTAAKTTTTTSTLAIRQAPTPASDLTNGSLPHEARGSPRGNETSSSPDATTTSSGSAMTAPSILDGFGQPETTAPAPAAMDEKAAREAKAAELLRKLKEKKAGTSATDSTAAPAPKPPPTQFKEPDANSLLDSFGF